MISKRHLYFFTSEFWTGQAKMTCIFFYYCPLLQIALLPHRILDNLSRSFLFLLHAKTGEFKDYFILTIKWSLFSKILLELLKTFSFTIKTWNIKNRNCNVCGLSENLYFLRKLLYKLSWIVDGERYLRKEWGSC